MSMPYLIFSCSRCDYSESDLFMNGRFSYKAPSSLLPISRKFGWCNECIGLSVIEDLPSTYKIDKLKANVKKLEEQITELSDRLMESRSWFKKLFNISITPPSEISTLKWQCDINETTIRASQQLLSLLEFRTSQPRCLKCGSMDNIILPELPKISSPDYPLFSREDPRPPIEIEFKHPDCGGNFLVKFSDVWVSLKHKNRIYDIEGYFIRAEKD